jgi:hypothetical protein
MNPAPRKLSLEEWEDHRLHLLRLGLREPAYGGPLHRHVDAEGDIRLEKLRMDNSAASLRLWNFLLTENARLREAKERGDVLVGAMKDLGTIPVMAFSLAGMRAFYPDGAWWTPCLMECGDRLLDQAAALGIDGSFCPVRAMLAAFENGEHFPRPDVLVCSVGAVCDDFSAIAQRLEHRGFPIHWWEVPRRRRPQDGEPCCVLPGGFSAPAFQVDCMRQELERVADVLRELTGQPLDADTLRQGIRATNEVRATLRALRGLVYQADAAVLPALEMQIAEMLALHFCSDREECLSVLQDLLAEARLRYEQGLAVVSAEAARVYWVNPTADLRLMNLIEDWGGRLCGSDYMFAHALDEIPEDLPPFEALARMALADPMVGSAADRAGRIVDECRAAGAEALVVCRIPGASHSAHEGAIIREKVHQALEIPSVEIEIPSVSDAMIPTLAGRLQALIETALARRKR